MRSVIGIAISGKALRTIFDPRPGTTTTNKKGLASLRGLFTGTWRRDPESNRALRICNPVHNRFAIAPLI